MNRKVTQKTPPFRCKKYLAWVRSFSCCICGTNQGVVSHHIIGYSTSGIALKSSDTLSIPICHQHHHELHTQGHKTFDIKYKRMNEPAQLYYVNLQLGRAKIADMLTSDQINEARGLIKT